MAAPDTLLVAVEDLCDREADWIKIINDPIDFDTPLLLAAVELAHQKETRVAVHAFTEEATIIALNAHADSIEHSPVGWKSVLAHPQSRVAYFVPTVVCSTDVVDDPIASSIQDEALLNIFQDWNREQLRLLPAAIDPDIRLALGTDTGFPPTLPGLSLHRELQLLTQIGFTPLTLLCNATALNAELLGQPFIGSFSSGCYADFVLVDGDPATMVEFYQSIVSVYLGGRCVYGKDFLIHRRMA